MNRFLIYLLELNIALLILYAAYRLFFEKDRNFVVRRIYLIWMMILPVVLPLIPETVRMAVNSLAPVSFNLEGVTIYASAPVQEAAGPFTWINVLIAVYLLILGSGILKLCVQFWRIIRAVMQSERMQMGGKTILSNPLFHASSFFGYIFIDPAVSKETSLEHILEHEQIHQKQWHSVDRILVELFVMINWFNPVVWFYRKSVIQNLEYLADSAVISQGTSPAQYQLSILNQYIGSASITNKFSSQIKNRINMLNKDYKLGSSWKLALILPLVLVAFIAISCSEKDPANTAGILKTSEVENMIYTEVDEMPTFQGEDPVMPFRHFIASNVIYPKQAIENSTTGKIFVKFIVRKDGTIEIPTEEEIAAVEGVSMDEVVVVGYRPIDEKAPSASKDDIRLLKEEATRVVLSSPKWGPGKVNGKPVDVMFTFPINFLLQ